MKALPYKSERLHALDPLRAIMMMLGIVFHSGWTYIEGKPNPFGNSKTHFEKSNKPFGKTSF